MSHPTPLAVIILTFNEEANLPECLSSLRELRAQVYVVDSGSTDRTVQIARDRECQVVEHPFDNYAAQRNWAFDHLSIQTPWVLCIDADERLTPELAQEIRSVIAQDDARYDGFIVCRRTVFMGRWLRFGGQYPAYHLRLFRAGMGRCEDRLYDQHFVVDGRVGKLSGDLIDVLTDNLTKWTERHNRWASLEANELLRSQLGSLRLLPKLRGSPMERRRYLRANVYYKLPILIRPFILWFFDYVLRLGFLDRTPGLIFHTLQRFWFRFLIDAKIYEMRRNNRRGGA